MLTRRVAGGLGFRALACMCQGGADVADRPRGWSLLHLTAALGQEASLKFLLGKKLPVNGAPYSPAALPSFWNMPSCHCLFATIQAILPGVILL